MVKHAGSGARYTVHLGYDEGVLAIRVTDDGGPSTTLPGYAGPNAAAPPPRPGAADPVRADSPADSRLPAAVGAQPDRWPRPRSAAGGCPSSRR